MWNIIFFACTIFMFCEATYLTGSIPKCGVNDSKCLIKTYETIINTVADNGNSELNIPPLEPYKINNLGIQIFGLIKATLIDGAFKGIKDCKIKNIATDLVNHRFSIEFLCENTLLEGQYKLERTPAFSALVGNINVHGEGKCSVEIKKYQLNLDVAFNIQKLADGELYLTIDTAKSTFTYKLLDEIRFTGNNLYIGKQEISDVAVKIMNENWEFVGRTLGKSILDEILRVVYEELNKLFSKLPLSQLTTDDLSPYITC